MKNRKPERVRLSREALVDVIGIPAKMADYTLDDFYAETYERRKMKKFVTEYIENLHENFDEGRGLYITGSNGVGKTFIASLILKEAYRLRYSCKRVTFMEYCERYQRAREAFGESKDFLVGELYTNYKSVDFLVLEEIGKDTDNMTRTIPIFEDLMRYREDKGLVTIIATNISAREFSEIYGKSLYSIIRGSLSLLNVEDDDMRRKK